MKVKDRGFEFPHYTMYIAQLEFSDCLECCPACKHTVSLDVPFRSLSDESDAGQGGVSRDRSNSIAQISQNFRPVTLTVNVFFKQVSVRVLRA